MKATILKTGGRSGCGLPVEKLQIMEWPLKMAVAVLSDLRWAILFTSGQMAWASARIDKSTPADKNGGEVVAAEEMASGGLAHCGTAGGSVAPAAVR